MAQMGLKYMSWAPIATDTETAIPTYTSADGFTVGKTVSLNVAVSNSEGELYADDMLVEYAAEFSSAELTAELDNISLDNLATLLGSTYSEEDGFSAKKDDTAPYGGVGGIQTLMVGGVKKWRAWFYPKAKAQMPDVDGSTKGSSISFATQSLKMKITSPNFGPWYYAKDFTSESEAKTWIDTKLGKTA